MENKIQKILKNKINFGILYHWAGEKYNRNEITVFYIIPIITMDNDKDKYLEIEEVNGKVKKITLNTLEERKLISKRFSEDDYLKIREIYRDVIYPYNIYKKYSENINWCDDLLDDYLINIQK